MEPKKNPKVDVGKRRGLFLEIGLVVALVFVIAAFSISQSEKVIDTSGIFQGNIDEIEMVEITMEEPPKQETVQQTINVIADFIDVVKNDTKITTNFDFVEFAEDEIVLTQVAVEVEEIEEDAPLYTAEVMPSFQGGGLPEFRNWVQRRIVYPDAARENGIQGTVNVVFVIERDGSLTNIQVVRSPDKTLSDAAVKVLQTSPKWEPARQRNVPVRLRYNMPIEFTLQ
jgi:TonB family C-terminal domain